MQELVSLPPLQFLKPQASLSLTCTGRWPPWPSHPRRRRQRRRAGSPSQAWPGQGILSCWSATSTPRYVPLLPGCRSRKHKRGSHSQGPSANTNRLGSCLPQEPGSQGSPCGARCSPSALARSLLLPPCSEFSRSSRLVDVSNSVIRSRNGFPYGKVVLRISSPIGRV